MKWEHAGIFVAVAVCLGTSGRSLPKLDSGSLCGTWFTTLAFQGRRPLQTMITFLEEDVRSEEGTGRWQRTSAHKFSVEFRLPAEDWPLFTGFEYHVTGVLALDPQGLLRGPLKGELLDSTGSVVSSLPGIAKATRLSQAPLVQKEY